MTETAKAFSASAVNQTNDLSSRQALHGQVLFAALGLYVAYLAYLTLGLGFNPFQSDVLNYWRESLQWTAPYSTWWVPGYPLTIALVRGLTGNALPPVAVMILIAGGFYLLAVRSAFVLAGDLGFRHPARVASLFATYPFVGLTYSVYPMADTMALALLLLCLIAFERHQWFRCAVVGGCAMLAHKAMWFFVPTLMAIAFVRHRDARKVLPLAVVPLLAWIGAGMVYHGDPLWFMRWSATHLLASRSSLPIGDGLIGPLLAGGSTKIMKGLVVVITAAIAVATLIGSLRRGFWLGVALAIPTLAMAIVINQYEIWAVVRFSRLLVIPAAWLLASRPHRTFLDNGLIVGGLVIVGIASNAVYGFYLARTFFQ